MSNVVPAEAHVELDVRVSVPEKAVRVDEELRGLTATVPGTEVSVTGGPSRPPFPATSSATLYARAAALADRLGLGPVDGVAVGGASDGNFTAAVGCPTLDGLGAVGGGAHAEDGYVDIAAMPERAALLAELINGLCAVD